MISTTLSHLQRQFMFLENAAKRVHYLEALAGVGDMETTETVLRTTKSEAVGQQLNYWLRIRAHS